ncbi:MAG: hypothetical protein ACYCST_09520 [Acidimicrobiales bacterium]
MTIDEDPRQLRALAGSYGRTPQTALTGDRGYRYRLAVTIASYCSGGDFNHRE